MGKLFTVTLSSIEVGDRYYACRICKTQIAPSHGLLPSCKCVSFESYCEFGRWSQHPRIVLHFLWPVLGPEIFGAQPAVDVHMGHYPLLQDGAMQFQLSKLQQYRMELLDGKQQGVIFVPNQNPNLPDIVEVGVEEDFPGLPMNSVDYQVQEADEQVAAADQLEELLDDDHHHHQQEQREAHHQQHVEGAHEVEHMQEDNQAEDVLAEDTEVAVGFHLELRFGDDHEQEEGEQANDLQYVEEHLQEDTQAEDVVAVKNDVQPQDEEAHHEEAHQAEHLQPEEERYEAENVAVATIGEVHDGVPPQDEENDFYAPNCCCCCC
ncbi:hypothetical protein ACH5RR_003921 [Cinchona calisaya]|uniref:Uncharacterized protein n=1 Tax=Cinchona calisaya TaxID=153742 RepID=A0ABD3AWE5_9GENT